MAIGIPQFAIQNPRIPAFSRDLPPLQHNPGGHPSTNQREALKISIKNLQSEIFNAFQTPVFLRFPAISGQFCNSSNPCCGSRRPHPPPRGGGARRDHRAADDQQHGPEGSERQQPEQVESMRRHASTLRGGGEPRPGAPRKKARRYRALTRLTNRRHHRVVASPVGRAAGREV